MNNEKIPRYYVAYGSNMNLEQMKRRCPTARPVMPTVLNGYRLRFVGPENGAVATIEPNERHSVPVLLWELEDDDEKALDSYEGFPSLYRKQLVIVDGEYQAVAAMVYIMNDIPGYDYNFPSLGYYETIEEGYMENNLDTMYLIEAVLGNFKEEY